ncbi:unnamed protein product [Heterobilharzia americana]|nr:unnamed protein product [Heterobilharzia americana]
MNNDDNKSDEEDFFSKFGQYEAERARRRTELVQDYLEFKRKEEESFYNRFSDKKKQFNSHQKSGVGFRQDAKYTKSEQNSSENTDMGYRLAELERKINSLFADKTAELQISRQPDLSDKHLVSCDGSIKNSEEVEKTLPFDNFRPDTGFEEDLRERLRQISEADKRLNLIEEEYNKLRFVDSQYAVDNLKNGSLALQSVAKTSDSEEIYFKNRQKAQYRRELDIQIAETEKRRLDEKAEETKLTSERCRPFCITETLQFSSNSGRLNEKVPSQAESMYFDIGERDLLGTQTSYPEAVCRKFSSNSSLKTNVPNSAELKLKKMQYAEELKKQIEEAKAKKAQQKREDEEYNRKIEKQSSNLKLSRDSDPIQQNLKSGCTEKSNQQSLLGSNAYIDMKLENNREPKGMLQPNFARGGHGIFGSPLTEAQKCTLQQYKEELAKQIAEKRCIMELEKRKEIELERRDTERIRADQIKMQKEFEMEQARKDTWIKKTMQQPETKESEYNEKVCKGKQLEGRTKPIQKVGIRCNRRPKASSSQKFSPTSSPEILIGPEATKLSQMKEAGSGITKKHSSEKTQYVLKQLNTLRTQLDMEKSKIESTYHQQKQTNCYDKKSVEDASARHRSRPQMNRKAIKMFQDSSNVGKNYISQSPYEDEFTGRPVKEDLSDICQKQVTLLRKQDNYLKELRREFEQNISQKNSANLLEAINLQPESQMNSSNLLMHMDDKLVEPQYELNNVSNSFPSGFIDLDEIAEKNKQRLMRLDAMQLLNEVSDDPESVLERFFNEHDGIFLND